MVSLRWPSRPAAPRVGYVLEAQNDAEGDPIAGRVTDRVRRLADDACITTFERLGDRLRAAAIMEGRLQGA
jgi:hypothetical protein